MPYQISVDGEENYKERVKEKIKRNVEINENGCWIWKKCKYKNEGYSYGSTTYKKKTISAHRVSYIVFKGDILNNKIVCHTCDEPLCVNPDHLWLGTHKENTRDMMKKKNVFQFKGEGNNSAILTDNIVLKMREMRKKGIKITIISKFYGIKYRTCCAAIRGKNWRHI